MCRSLSVLLCALAAVLVQATPAPFPRTDRPWYTGWDRPADPRRDCRFDRKGGRLTITVPGKGHEIDLAKGRLQAPHLLRSVEGDFAVQVRVGGNFRPTGRSGYHRAGLLVTDGTIFIKFEKAVAPKGFLEEG